MAITNIKGTVSRTFHNGCGAEVTETFTKRNGEEGKTRWTCWFETAHGLAEGDQVAVSGMHGDQVDEWTDKQGVVRYSVKRSLNGARLGKDRNTSDSRTGNAQAAQEPEPWASAPPADSWALDSNNPVPF
jgi:hypothetical protein